MLKHKLVLPAAILMVVAAAVLVVFVVGSASAHKAPHKARQASATNALLSAFSVLRKTATSGEAPLPPSVSRAAATEGSQLSKTEPELTGEVEVAGQYPVWVPPEAGKSASSQKTSPGQGSVAVFVPRMNRRWPAN